MSEISDDTLVQVQNLVDHTVGFKDEDTHRRVIFQAYEPKKLPAGILRRLNFSYGGTILLRHFLSVQNDELAREFGVSPDTIEYKWTKNDVDRVLTTGSLPELEDALDFGPEGIKDLIVDRAVELKIDNVSKRQVIKEHTGRDIDSMIKLKEQYEANNGQPEETQPKTRRVNTKATGEEAPSGRRVAQ